MPKHSSRIELSQSAVKNNINFIRKKIGPDPIICCVVKANAYGHSTRQYIPMLEKAGVKYFATASAFEAEEVYENTSPDSRIMIMGILYDEDIDWAIENEIEFYVFNYDRFPRIVEKAKTIGKKAKVHLEVETGSNRTGLPAKDFTKTISFMKKNKAYIEFIGLCSHLGGAENFSNMFKIERQHKRFNEFLAELKRKSFMPEIRHLSCSGAALAYPDMRYDMVRIGVAQYGFWPSPDIYYKHLQDTGKLKDNPLQRIISWKTDVMDVRNVKKDEFIGYGTAYQATTDMKIAVLPLGYSNGYPRGASNRGHVLIHGKKAPIVGLINMNLFMVDITHIPDVEVGDEVVLVGRQKNNVINIASFTNSMQLLNNEMLSRLPHAIPRYVKR